MRSLNRGITLRVCLFVYVLTNVTVWSSTVCTLYLMISLNLWKYLKLKFT